MKFAMFASALLTASLFVGRVTSAAPTRAASITPAADAAPQTCSGTWNCIDAHGSRWYLTQATCQAHCTKLCEYSSCQ
jgi:hypothetical protein